MILSSNMWKSEIYFHIEVELTTSPSTVTVTDDFGSFSVPFTIIDNLLKLSVRSRSSAFKVEIDTEPKVLEFVSDSDIFEMEGDLEVPFQKSGSSVYLYIPVCDYSRMEIKCYSMDGVLLETQGLRRTPFWGIDDEISKKFIEGIEVYCFEVDFDLTYYLASNNVWELITSIPFRAVVSGCSFPKFAEKRTQIIFKESLYNKKYYAEIPA